jgi:hypothetical protein
MSSRMETMYSRWSTEPRVDEKGNVKPVIFNSFDLDICRLLTPYAREPWGYQYLPTHYIALLLDRSYEAIRARMTKLLPEPYEYVRLPDQPQTNSRFRIFSVAPNGLDEIQQAGIVVPKFKLRPMPHELLACMAGASFEYGARKHGLPIRLKQRPECDGYPDWPFFTLGDTDIWLEADTGSERGPDKKIRHKYDLLLGLIAKRRFKGKAVFITARPGRIPGLISELREAIDEQNYPHDYAEHFAFTHITWDRFLNKLQPLTDWAVKDNYQTALRDSPKFNFLK